MAKQTLTEILTKAGITFGPELPGTIKREWFDAYGELIGQFNGWPEVHAYCLDNADYADDTGPNREMRVLADFEFVMIPMRMANPTYPHLKYAKVHQCTAMPA